MQRLSELSSLHQTRHPFLSIQRPPGPVSSDKQADIRAGDSKEDEEAEEDDQTDDEEKRRKKKTRTVFSRSQVFQLESTFDMKRYLSSSERAALAASLHLTETQVLCCISYCILHTT